MWKDQFDPEKKEALRQAEIQQNTEWLQSDDLHQRRSAVKRLGELQAAPELLLPFLGDMDLETRVEAINSIGNLNEVVSGDLHSEIVSHLRGLLNDPNGRVISAAVRSLGLFQVEEACPEIRELLDETDQQIVHTAIIALARLDDRASLDRILTFLDARSSYLRQAAWRAVGLFQYTPMIPTLLSNFATALEEHPLSKPSFGLIQVYVEVCKRLKVTAAIPLLLQIIQTEIGLRTKAVNALLELEPDTFPVELLALLDDPNLRLRIATLKLMGQTRYRLLLNHIRKLLNDESPAIRMAALEYVCEIRNLASVATVRFLCYRDSLSFVRTRAIAALVSLTDANALSDLQALAFDADVSVRSAVASAIGEFSNPLPDQAIAILNHLRNDSATREIAETILQNLPDHPIPSAPLASPKTSLPFPDQWVVSRKDFLTACVQWHTALGKAEIDESCADEVFTVQSALSSIIVTLSRER